MWLGSGPARGLVGLNACVASSTMRWPACSVATANRPAAHPHATAPSGETHERRRWHACAFSQGVGHGRGRRPHSRLPTHWRTSTELTKRLRAHRQLRPRGGPEPAPMANALARGQRAKRNELKRPPVEATRCTAPHPTRAPSTVPRETPTHRKPEQPTHPPGVCPSSPSTPPPTSAPNATKW